MFYYLHEFHEYFGVLNVFQYTTFRAVAAAISAFLLCLMFGNRVIRKLISLKVGQPIRTAEEVHRLNELHGQKAGTPTMGGVLLLGAVVASTMLWARPDNALIWLGILTILVLGGLGFVDDYLKVTKRKSAGVSSRMKIVVQLGLGVAVGWFLLVHPTQSLLAESLYVPFFKDAVVANMGWFAIGFIALVITGSSNAVNLTDGLDGLAAGCSAMVAFTYAVLVYAAGHVKIANYLQIPFNPLSAELAVPCLALVGASLGFLWFNCHPARVFMGDTGSLAIGGFIAVMAIACKQELLLILVGGVFVMEAGSVILQVLSFKLTGRRIFAMSPIHHHFELKGWKENTVIVRFWILGIMCALFGIATLKLR